MVPLHVLSYCTVVLYLVALILLVAASVKPQLRARVWGEYVHVGAVSSLALLVLTARLVLWDTFLSGEYLLWVGLGLEVIRGALRFDYPVVRLFTSAVSFASLCAGMALLHIVEASRGISSLVLLSHVAPAALAQVCVLTAMVVSLLFLSAHRRLKRKAPELVYSPAPALTLLDSVHGKLSVAGLVCMSISVITGSLVMTRSVEAFSLWDATTCSAFLSWGLLLVLTHLRQTGWSMVRLSVITLSGGCLILLLCGGLSLIQNNLLHRSVVL